MQLSPCGLGRQQLHYGDYTGREKQLNLPRLEGRLRKRERCKPGAGATGLNSSPPRSLSSPLQRPPPLRRPPPNPVTLALGMMQILVLVQAVRAQGCCSPERQHPTCWNSVAVPALVPQPLPRPAPEKGRLSKRSWTKRRRGHHPCSVPLQPCSGSFPAEHCARRWGVSGE